MELQEGYPSGYLLVYLAQGPAKLCGDGLAGEVV